MNASHRRNNRVIQQCYSPPGLQVLGREQKLFINVFSMIPMQKPQTLTTDSISLPVGYLSRHILIKWHNSGH